MKGNTATRVESSDERTDGAVVTTIERETTGGLQSTADDYVVNLQVAAQLSAQDGDTSTTTDNT